MEVLDNQAALRIVTLFSGAIKGMGFYPASHPSIRQPLLELDKIMAGALGKSPEISWGIIDGAMFFDEHLFINPSTAIADLTNRMMEKEIGRIVVAGLASTRPGVVSKVLGLKPGQAAGPQALLAAQRRLLALGIFEDVSVRPIPGQDSGRRGR